MIRAEAKNTYVAVVLHKNGHSGALRYTCVSSPQTDVTDDQFARRTAHEYAATMGWRDGDYTVQLVGPLAPADSRVLYDSLPGDRMTVAQIDKLVARVPGAINARRRAL